MNDPDYKLLWERDSASLGKTLNELSMVRTCNQDLKAANSGLRDELTAARLERDQIRREAERLNVRVWALTALLYPYVPPREALAEDIGWVE